VTQSGSAAGDSCKDDDVANTQKESNKAEPAGTQSGSAAGDSCKDDDGANTQKESNKSEPAGTPGMSNSYIVLPPQQLVLKACNNLCWISSILLFGDNNFVLV